MAKTILREPTVKTLPERPYVGIQIQTPFKGMFQQVDKLRPELDAWLAERDITPKTPPFAFLRFHVIDMSGEMDVEYGVPVEVPVPGDERINAGMLPAGRYVTLIFIGHGLYANKTLIDWSRENNYDFDRWDDGTGDAFRCRYEAYLTDPSTEHRKTKWEVEIAIRLVDAR